MVFIALSFIIGIIGSKFVQIQIDNNSFIQFLLPIMNYSIEDNYAIKFVNGENPIILFNHLNNDGYKVFIKDGKIVQSNIIKMSYPKVLSTELELLINTINPKMTNISGKKTSKNNPGIQEISEIIPNQSVFTDSIGAVWLFSDGNHPIEVKDWK